MAAIDRILVVGGGIGGLCLAAALHRQGFAPELVERSPAWPAIGAGIALHANGVRVLRGLGLGEAIDRATAVLPRWTFLDQRGEPLCETDLEALWGEVGPCLGITRIRLQEILLDGAAAVPHRLGVAVTALRQEGERVEVGFGDGSWSDYDLVVGADGIYSTVRSLAVSPAEPDYAGTMAWRSVVPTRPPGVDGLMVLMGEGCFGGPVPAYLEALERDQQLHAGPIEWVDLDRWHQDRVVLIGDAAHAAPPHMGEGGSMAMEDAVVLAEELRAAPAVEAALDRYERYQPLIAAL